MKDIKLSGCIVTYNSADEIVETITEVLDATKNLDFTLYISDNNSSDDTVEKINDNFKNEPRLVLLDNKENGGFGAGHNKVLDMIDSKYHFLINPDITVNEEAITGIVEFFEKNDDIGMLCPKILNEDGSEQILPMSIPKFRYLVCRYLNIFPKTHDKYVKKDKRDTDILDIEFCTGCFSVVRTELFKKVNGFDDRFFLYFEDADLTREINRISRVVNYRKVAVVHKWERASKKQLKYFLISIKSMFKYFWKWKFRK